MCHFESVTTAFPPEMCCQMNHKPHRSIHKCQRVVVRACRCCLYAAELLLAHLKVQVGHAELGVRREDRLVSTGRSRRCGGIRRRRRREPARAPCICGLAQQGTAAALVVTQRRTRRCRECRRPEHFRPSLFGSGEQSTVFIGAFVGLSATMRTYISENRCLYWFCYGDDGKARFQGKLSSSY